jgi:adenylosuccinate synthase
MNIDIVIGAGFGDEGKGKIVDILSNKLTLNIKFTGGAQAGHTVVTPDRRHIFSTYGSGTFQMADTYLTQHFIFNPLLFEKEHHLLKDFVSSKYDPMIWINNNCNITTPYDMLINCAVERKRGNNKHGSCGIGINETLYRSNKGFGLYVKDFFSSIPMKLIQNIRDQYVPLRLEDLGVEIEDFAYSDEFIRKFIDDVYRMFTIAIPVNDIKIKNQDNLVFEGAQGLGLDRNHKHFPHVTNGNTGLKNALEVLRENNLTSKQKNIYYVTRPYKTRHGAGPLEHENDSIKYVDNTNVHNEWQENLRFAYLDIDVLVNDISNDIEKNKQNINKYDNFYIVINCIDQMKKVIKYYENSYLNSLEKQDFPYLVMDRLSNKTGKSFTCCIGIGETRNDVYFLRKM